MKIEPATVTTVAGVFGIAVAELARNGVTKDHVELRLSLQLHLRRRRGGLSMCRSLGAVLADIMEIQCIRRTFAIPDIGKIGLADEFGAGRGYPEQKILRLTYLVLCRQGSQLGRAVLLGLAAALSASSAFRNGVSNLLGISGLHSITTCHRFDELSECVSKFMDIVQRLCLFNRLRFTLKHV